MSNPTRWQDLIVENEGESFGTLGSVVSNAVENLDEVSINADGAIAEWPMFLIAAPGEEHGWDTPRGPVDWTGFRPSMEAAFAARAASEATHNA